MAVNGKPKVLLYDIETAPILGHTWQLYETNVIAVERDWYMLAFAYKWLGEDKLHTRGLCDYPDYKPEAHSDKALCLELHSILDQADVVIGHNLDAFDNKKANARFVVHGLKPPAPSKTVDTLKIARKHFRFDSNKLDSLGQLLGLGQKLPTGGVQLWLDCMKGDAAAWKRMKDYNGQDVELLEKVYNRLKPWATNHPDLSAFTNGSDHVCPTCQSTNLQRRGRYVKLTRQYQRYACQDCGSWSHGELING